jgi:hypothetical protein
MRLIGYRIAERFSPQTDEGWSRFVEWSGLTHLTEVVGLDSLLCPSVLPEFVDDDWNHLLYGEQLGDCFDDCEYLRRRIADAFDGSRHQVLAVAREMREGDIESVRLPGFTFKGFDLIDEEGSISALTNCGGFERAFKNSELTDAGLVLAASRAYEIQDALRTEYPDDPHAKCVVWAIWRMDTVWATARRIASPHA